MNIPLSHPAILGSLYFLCSCNVTEHADSKTSQDPEQPYDVIIVPGVPYKDPSMKIIFKTRVLWAKYLYDRGITKNIIFSGSSVYSPFVEGKVMKIYADSLGIPAAHTFAETAAEHSTENIHFSVRLAKKLGFRRIALATDPFQSAFLSHFLRKNYPGMKSFPIKYDKIDVLTSPWPAVDASSARVGDFVSIMHREKRLQRFRGTLGKNIVKEQDKLPKRKHKYAVF